MGRTFTVEEFTAVARRCTQVFGPDDPIETTLIIGGQGEDEGYVNQLARSTNLATGRSIVLKKTLDFAQRAPEISEGLDLPLTRNHLEAQAFRLWNAFTPGCAPAVLLCDREQSVFAMEDLAGLNLARFEFVRLHQYPQFGRVMGGFLARNAFHTSDFFLRSSQREKLHQVFAKPEFHELYENVYFTNPLLGGPEGDQWTPSHEVIAELLDDPRLHCEFLELRHHYMNKVESLTHSDLHTANIFVSPQRICVIDGESVQFGPMGYDLGMLIGNLVIACLTLQVRPGVSRAQVENYEDYLIDTVTDLFTSSECTFRELWAQRARPTVRGSQLFLDRLVHQILVDACGFAATQVIAVCAVPRACVDLRTLPAGHRDTAIWLAGFTAREILLRRHGFTDHRQLTELFKTIKITWRATHGALGHRASAPQ